MPTDSLNKRSPFPAPPIDFARMAFPSDKITVADLRRIHPQEFDTNGRNFFDGPKIGRVGKNWSQEALSEMLLIERMIARLVYEPIRQGKPRASVLSGLWEDDVELIEALAGYYGRYGVAHDLQETLKMIASIEEQAAQQAEDFTRMRSDAAP